VQLQQTGVVEGQESPGNTIILHVNEAASVTIQHGVKDKAVKENTANESQLVLSRGEFNATAFVLPSQMRQYAEEQRLKPLRRWQAYSRELRKDPALVAYYPFEQIPPDGSASVLPNRSAAGTALDGRVGNGEWVDGRLPGKLALKLKCAEDGVKINIPVVMNDITLAAWVNIDLLDNGLKSPDDHLNGLLMSDGWMHNGQLHWQLQNDGIMVCHAYNAGEQRGAKYRHDSLTHLTPDQFKRWLHLAVVYDHVAAKL
jgi:hypothetical protein